MKTKISIDSKDNKKLVLSLFKRKASLVYLKEDLIRITKIEDRNIQYVLRLLLESEIIESVKYLKDSRKNVYFLKKNRHLITIGDIRK